MHQNKNNKPFRTAADRLNTGTTIMTTTAKNQMRQVMNMAHSIYKATAGTRSWSEVLKNAWMVIKLQLKMRTKMVEFWYVKVSTGETRQAFGTLIDTIINPLIKNNPNYKRGKDCITYFDVQKQEFRCFKSYNLVKVVA